MKKNPDANMRDQFMAFMEANSEIFDHLSTPAYSTSMQQSITHGNGWNAQNNDNIDGYEGWLYFEKHYEAWKE